MEVNLFSKNIWWLLTLSALLALLALPLLAQRGTACPLREGCVRRKGQRVDCAEHVDSKLLDVRDKLRVLNLCRWPGPGFDPQTELGRFSQLQRFSLQSSNVSFLHADFPPLQRLQALNLSGLQLERLEATALAELRSLRELDLRHNRLQELGPPPASLHRLFLAGNPWNCSGSGLAWLAEAGGSNPGRQAPVLRDADQLVCRDAAFNRRPLPVVLRYRQLCERGIFPGGAQDMEEGCPREPAPCRCSLTVVPGMPGRDPASHLIPVITVDCAGRGLRELPAALPANTSILRLSGNLISDLRPLASNDQYGSVVELYLDDNRVASVAELEGAPWLLHFRLLSLRANRLTHLPTYALERALERNRQASRLYLGRNPWHCDCQYTPSFQEFLVKYNTLVQDVADIKCSVEDGDGKALVRIQDISRSSLCTEPSGYLIQPLDLLNGILATLILLILGKLAYDYWNFKKTGKVPWIVTKMP